jgi:hypothetical protein
MKLREKCFWAVVLAAALAFLAACVSGCSTLDRAYRQEVSWIEKPVRQTVTNVVLVTNVVAEVVERARVVWVTNEVTGAVAERVVTEPVATNLVTTVMTNFVPVFLTNLVQVPLTNFVARPEAEAVIDGTGAIVNAFAPGIGSILALALGGLYHGYRQVRNRRVNEALIQGVETARAVLTTTPQGQAADAQLVKWLMAHQKEAGVFAAVARLVDEVSDNPAARMTAEEILERISRAQGKS